MKKEGMRMKKEGMRMKKEGMKMKDMRKVWKKAAFMVIAAASLMIATGCSTMAAEETEGGPVNLAIIGGYRSNSTEPNLTAAIPYIQTAAETYGYVSVIVPDGQPFQSAQADVPKPDKSLSENKRKQIAAAQAQEIVNYAVQAAAKTPETNTLEAIGLGARSLHAREEGCSYMLILDSCISTTGVLDFTECYLEALDVDGILGKLEQEQALCDLTDIHVVVIGLGDTALPQQPLSEKNRRNLQAVWQAVLEKAGAASVTFKTDLGVETGNYTGEAPEVTPVEVLQPVSAIDEETGYVEETVVLDQEVLNFQPGSAELLTDAAEVQEKLQPVIDYMIDHPDYRIVIFGTTASADTQEKLKILSEARCGTVKEIMLAAGVPEGQIQTKGLGFDEVFCENDINEDGSFNEEIGSRNRSVILMPAASQLAEELLKK